MSKVNEQILIFITLRITRRLLYSFVESNILKFCALFDVNKTKIIEHNLKISDINSESIVVTAFIEFVSNRNKFIE